MGIPIKEKKCKGTGQASGYGCGKLTMFRVYGLCKMKCYPEWLLNSDAGKAKLQKAVQKVQKPRLELEKEEGERKSRSALKNALEATKQCVHAYVRKRDEGKPCISCGEPWRPEFQAGHYHKAELYETLRFDLRNINGQCPGCNIHKEGNLEQYNINLPRRIGNEAFSELQKLAQVDKHFSKIWNVDNLKAIREQIRTLNQK